MLILPSIRQLELHIKQCAHDYFIAPEQISVTQEYELLSAYILAQWRHHYLTCPGKEWFEYPEDWWQAFKQEYAQRWWMRYIVRKHPVKKTIIYAVAYFPDQQLLDIEEMAKRGKSKVVYRFAEMHGKD